jgi:hypothetical protein
MVCADSDPPTMHVPFAANLSVYAFDDARGDGEAESFAAAGLRQDEGVDPDDVPLGIHQRASAIAWIDGGVGLDVHHHVVGMERAGDRTDHAHTDRAFQTERAAESHHQFALMNAVGVAER